MTKEMPRLVLDGANGFNFLDHLCRQEPGLNHAGFTLKIDTSAR